MSYRRPSKPEPERDYTKTCKWRRKGRYHKYVHCDEYCLLGSNYCPKHAPKQSHDQKNTFPNNP